ncbi:hypothetical protein NLI96_g9595 [Meripilus lineatus]|uniref:DUF6593 domain-containing protein n=1 Tax=Meripilus lineatus TaxID=2056292 RepID=A0AAD5UXE9_9APHY|nr:hypothetical protein NLI96_g9595 [Physisporinus lineatus]
MDSQVTLIDIPIVEAASPGRTVLEFCADDVHNTVVRIRGERGRLYTVESTKDISATKVYRTNSGFEPEVVALITRNNVLPDQVAFSGGQAIRIGKFLKSSALSNFPATMEVDGRKYIWKRNIVDPLTVCMFSTDSISKPLAWFCKSQRRLLNDQMSTTPAYLEIDNEVIGARDLVFVACIILEHRLRMLAKTSGIVR